MLASIAILFVVNAELVHVAENASKGESAHHALEEVFANKTLPGEDDYLETSALPKLHESILSAHNSLGDVLHMGLSSPIHADSTPEHAEKVAMKFTKMLQMFAFMHRFVKPVKKELEATLSTLAPGKAKYHTEFLLEHVNDLDKQSMEVNSLLEKLHEADGAEAKHEALHKLMQGVVAMKDDLYDNLASLKEAISPITHKVSPFMKMRVVLHKLAKKIKKELTDPKMKQSAQVLLDVRMYKTVKTAVQKAETLIAAGSLALKKEPSKHMELAIHRVMKRRMAMVTADLKTEMHKIKLEREELIKEGKQMKSEKSEEKAEKAPVDATEKQLRQHGVPMPDPAVDE